MCAPRRRFVNTARIHDTSMIANARDTLNPPVFLRTIDGKGPIGDVEVVVVVEVGCSGVLSTIFYMGFSNKLQQAPFPGRDDQVS